MITCAETGQFDEYSSEGERRYMKQSHMETTHLLALLVSCIVGKRSSEEAYNRKFQAACLLKDLIDARAVPSLSAVVVGDDALPVVGGSVRQVPESSLARCSSWSAFREWWDLARLDGMKLPTKPVNNSVSCQVLSVFVGCCISLISPFVQLRAPLTLGNTAIAQVDAATLGELAAACLLQGSSLSSKELLDVGHSLVQQWVQALVPLMKTLANHQPPAPQRQKDLLQHGYYDWVLSEMQADARQHSHVHQY